MLDSGSCPVCGREDWSHVETCIYSREDGPNGRTLRIALAWRKLRRISRILVLARPRTSPVTCRALSSYQLLRRRVLFEIWFPAWETVTLRAAYCASCGFTAYFPRPTEQEVAAKYDFLKQHEPDIGGQAGYGERALASDLTRATTVYRRCTAHLESRRLRVLDYGGGNGKLLKPFVAAGHHCYLIDYNDNPVPGVTKICDDMSTFCGDGTFDLIICSHVLEHVSDISGLATFLHSHLDVRGLLYVEVPQEIWAGLSIEADPVTHINFFTTNSLASLLMLTGLALVETKRQIADYGDIPLEVIWMLSRRGDSGVEAGATGDDTGRTGDAMAVARGQRNTFLPADVRPLLYPSRGASLVKLWRLSIAPRIHRFRSRARRRSV